MSDFIQSIFGMAWLKDIITFLLELIFGPNVMQETWANIVHYFIYDVIKISIFLCVLIFIISYIQSFFPPERTKKLLQKYKGIGANLFGALLGTVTPFCSCSSIPIFIGFQRAGLSAGVTFSFLISSPLVDLGAFVLITAIFGLEVAIIYVVMGLILAVIGGTIIEKTSLKDDIESFVLAGESFDLELEKLTQKDRIHYASEQVKDIFKKVFLYIIIGVSIGAVIHNFIPQTFIESILGKNNPFSVIIASIIGAPIYADIFGTIPIAESLYLKGAGLGTILAFMMSVTTLSIPSFILLKKVLKTRLLIWFGVIVMIGIILIGYLFNWLMIFI